MILRALSLAGAMLAIAATPAPASDLAGVWNRGDGKARVRIAPCGSNLCATNIWVGAASGEKVGDRLVMTLTKKGEGAYSGSAFDPQRNMTVSMNIRVAQKSFTSSGCVLGGVICKSMSWTR